MDNGIFARNIGTISEREQRKLAGTRIGIVGLGGTGSPAFELLVRIGVGKFVLFEKDSFKETNFNRQLYAIGQNLGELKIKVAAGKARKINPKIKIEEFAKKLDARNVGKLKNCDIVLDCTDNIETRIIVSEFCAKKKIPYVFCSAGKSQGMVSVFQGKKFGEIFGRIREWKTGSVIAPAAFIAGAFAGTQAISVILNKKYVEAPEFIFFDVFSQRFFWKGRL